LTGEAWYKAKLPERRDTKLLTLLSMLKEEVCRLTQEADEPKEAGEKSRYSTLVLQCKKNQKHPASKTLRRCVQLAIQSSTCLSAQFQSVQWLPRSQS